LPDKFYQKCPLCGEDHPAMMRGKVQDMESGNFGVIPNKGYSFCNCRNIFYTDWSNIDLKVYDRGYYEKYQLGDSHKLAITETNLMYPVFKKYGNPKTFFEIGAIHDFVMGNMASKGLECSGIDITEHDSNYNVIIGNFEDFKPTFKKYDIIWASHIFEHFKDPKMQLLKCKEMLSPDGMLYIAMPDTFFIDFEHGNVMQWDWVITEHHILWGMDSFITFAEELGLKCVFSDRNTELNQKTNGDWFWKQDFKVVFKHA
jgi:predicted SAM-dependent methyltransferase